MNIKKNVIAGFIVGCLLFLILSSGPLQAQPPWPQAAPSSDGTLISYEIYGTGEPTLVFVHGWSCDARYWRAQIPHFSKKHQVVVLDLAGHGHSGMSRQRYGMVDFGQDVRAVVEKVGSRSVILVGHSMGGTVIAEAARLMPDRVVGLVGVDTLENIEYPLTREEFKTMYDPLEKDFASAVRQFVGQMISPATDPRLADWILDDVAAAPPAVALSAMNEMMEQYITGAAAKVFEKIKVPVVSVNGDMWPIDYEANRRHMVSYDAIVLKGADHFLMMNRHEEFNGALEKAIVLLREKHSGKTAE